MTKTIYLVDASTFIHRSYHAIGHLSTKDGRPTNAVYGFVATINKLLREKNPEYLALAFDAKGPTFRHERYPEYKANRPPMPEDLIAQQEPIRGIVRAMGLPSLEVPGLEADDIIATLAVRAAADDFQVVIVAGDKDYFQLLSPRISLYDPNPKRETSTTVESFSEKFGIKPEEFLEAQGLMGDSTDNIPGVPGVGEKTAMKLVREYGRLENLYENLETVKQQKLRAKLAENREAAFLSRDLARLKSDADLGESPPEALKVASRDTETLRAVYNDLEFSRFATDLGPERRISYDNYCLVATEAEFEDLLKELDGISRLSVDLETTSVDPMRAEIVGVSLAARTQHAYYIPVGHSTLGAVQLDWDTVSERLRPILESDRIEKVGQNIKYDYIVLLRHGLRLGPLTDDTMVASYLLDPGGGGHNLERISREHLGHDPITYKSVVGDKNSGFDRISPEAACEYACEDADLALILAETLRPKLESAGLLDLYQTLEIPLIEVLAEMEMNGVGLDRGLLADLSRELGDKMAASEARIHELAGRKFNVNSPKQLGQVLFDDLGLPQGKKTKKKSGYSTDVEVLSELAAKHDLPAEVLNFRGLTKLRSTYVDALAQLINPATGRVHTSFNQSVTATGRLSSSDPNLQNIPVRTEEGRRIREAFVPDPGHVILSADYSQIELRILAHYSEDPGLRDAFIAGDDIHARTASEVFNVLPGLLTPEMRREAKAINFGIVYGLQAFGLAKQLNIERKVAQKYIDDYFARYAGVKNYIDQTPGRSRADRIRHDPHGPPPPVARAEKQKPPGSLHGRTHGHQHPHSGIGGRSDKTGHACSSPVAAQSRLQSQDASPGP